MNNPITPKDYCGECNATLPPKFCAEIVGTTTTTVSNSVCGEKAPCFLHNLPPEKEEKCGYPTKHTVMGTFMCQNLKPCKAHD